MKSAAILAFGGASGGVLTTRQSGKRSPSGTPALAAEPAQADRFSKARSARSASMLEDYTELIADLIAASGEATAFEDAIREHPEDWHMLQKLFVNDLDPERLARSRNRPVTNGTGVSP